MKKSVTGTHRFGRQPIRRRLAHLARAFIATSFTVGVLAGPAAAQFTRIAALPPTDVFAIRIAGDTLAAAVDSTVFVSVDAGATWQHALPVADAVVDGLVIRAGRLYAGTFGKGVFVSDDLGASWQAFNQGLVGGFLNTQLSIADLELSGDLLVAATSGDGVWARNLAGADTWHRFGNVFEPNQAPNVNDVAFNGTRLLVCAGANGTTFHRDPADVEWTVDFLVNGTLSPGLSAQTAHWTGARWLVGGSSGVFLSPNGEQPWTRSTTIMRNVAWSVFAQRGATTFAAFDSVNFILFAESHDAGTSWTIQERVVQSFAYQLAVHGSELYAARSDGLWVRQLGVTAVEPGRGTAGLRFALTTQPVRDVARFRFELPRAAEASIDLFDVTGRRAADRIAGFWPAGQHELSIDGRRLRPGVYSARLTSGGMQRTVRLVRVP